jgi:hypothetical protein
MLAARAPTGRSPLDVVSLSRLMERTAGRPEVVVGLIDGPVVVNHADFAAENIRVLALPPNWAVEWRARRGTRAWNLCRRHSFSAT